MTTRDDDKNNRVYDGDHICCDEGKYFHVRTGKRLVLKTTSHTFVGWVKCGTTARQVFAEDRDDNDTCPLLFLPNPVYLDPGDADEGIDNDCSPAKVTITVTVED